jgi:hypothetical protein
MRDKIALTMTMRSLGLFQHILVRIGARIILRAFRQVSLEVLEAEAYLESTTHRLTNRTAKHIGKLLAADQSNPAREALLIKCCDSAPHMPQDWTANVYPLLWYTFVIVYLISI